MKTTDKTNNVSKLIAALNKYPVEAMFCKGLIEAGVDTEEKLIELLKINNVTSTYVKCKIQNAFRNVKGGGLYDKKMPTLIPKP